MSRNNADERLRPFDGPDKIYNESTNAYVIETDIKVCSLVPRMAEEAVHMVRNPLCAIKGAVDLARDEGSLTELWISVIEEEVKDLEHAMENLASLSGGEYEELHPVDLCALLAGLSEAVSDQAVKSGVWLTWSGPQGRTTVLGNASRLRLAFEHLIANAIEASPRQGIVHIALKRVQDKALLEVANVARDLPLPTFEQMAAPFFSTRKGQAGLGLTVAGSIIRAHQGRLQIKSRDSVIITTASLPLLTHKAVS